MSTGRYLIVDLRNIHTLCVHLRPLTSFELRVVESSVFRVELARSESIIHKGSTEEGPGGLLVLRREWHDAYSHAYPDDKGPVTTFLKGRKLVDESEMQSAVHVGQKQGQDKNMALWQLRNI